MFRFGKLYLSIILLSHFFNFLNDQFDQSKTIKRPKVNWSWIHPV